MVIKETNIPFSDTSYRTTEVYINELTENIESIRNRFSTEILPELLDDFSTEESVMNKRTVDGNTTYTIPLGDFSYIQLRIVVEHILKDCYPNLDLTDVDYLHLRDCTPF